MGVVTEIVMGTGRGTSTIGRGRVIEDVATVDGSHDRDHDRRRSRYIIILKGEGLIKEYLSSPTTPPPFIATSITISFGNFSPFLPSSIHLRLHYLILSTITDWSRAMWQRCSIAKFNHDITLHHFLDVTPKLILFGTYYSQNYASIIYKGLAKVLLGVVGGGSIFILELQPLTCYQRVGVGVGGCLELQA